MVRYKNYLFGKDINGGYILYKEYKNKKKNVMEKKVICYPSTINGVVKKIMTLELEDGGETDITLQQFADNVNALGKEIMDNLDTFRGV